MALFQHGLEQHQKIEIGPGEVNFIQHILEIISLESSPPNCDPQRRRRVAEARNWPPTPTELHRLP
jgi:hypothetical protein